MALLTALVSEYAGRLGGVVGLSGYLPLAERVDDLREDKGFDARLGAMEVFLARGSGDRVVPRRYQRLCCEALYRLGIGEERVVAKEYEGMGHGMGGAELRDLCAWLERLVPVLE